MTKSDTYFENVTKESNYNVALSVGDKNSTIIQKNTYYLAKGEKLQQVRGRKQVANFFTEFGFDAKTAIKKNRFKMRKEQGLVSLVKLFNATKGK